MGHLALRTCSGNLNIVSINFNTSVSAQSLDYCLRLLFFFRNRCDYSMYRFVSASRREWRTRWNSSLLTVTGECLVDFYSCNIQQTTLASGSDAALSYPSGNSCARERPLYVQADFLGDTIVGSSPRAHVVQTMRELLSWYASGNRGAACGSLLPESYAVALGLALWRGTPSLASVKVSGGSVCNRHNAPAGVATGWRRRDGSGSGHGGVLKMAFVNRWIRLSARSSASPVNEGQRRTRRIALSCLGLS